MITIRKLKTLKRDSRLRKICRLFREFEEIIFPGGSFQEFLYVKGLFQLILIDNREAVFLSNHTAEKIKQYISAENPLSTDFLRDLQNIRYEIQGSLGIETGDWDFHLAPGNLDPGKRIVKPFSLYLEDIRSPFNVGSIFRTAESFCVEKIILSPDSASPAHPRAERSSMGCIGSIPWKIESLEYLEQESNIFALETGGTPVDKFDFPESGCMIVGSEELGISSRARTAAETSLGICSIPLFGSKGSINVAAALGIVLFMWNS